MTDKKIPTAGDSDKCNIPPEGWKCSRAPGHDGPCAARSNSTYDRYIAQETEWKEICNEMVAAGEDKTITAYQVTLEQRKRMLARGERPMEYKEILEAIATETASRGM